jgi:hypothetical protein
MLLHLTQILEHQLHQLKMLVLKLREEVQQQKHFIGKKQMIDGTLKMDCM